MKLLKNLALEKGLSYDKKRVLAYGRYRDYSISVRYEPRLRKYSVSAYANLPEGMIAQPLHAFGQGLQTECKKVTTTDTENRRLTVFLVGKGSGKKDMKNLDLVLNRFTDYLRLNGFQDACSTCGTADYLHWYDLNNQVHHMCDHCFGQQVNSLEINKQEIKAKRGNMFTGIVGALLGSLIGVALWVVVAQMGYISGIVGLIMALCILKGYELFGGKVNVPGMAICVVILLVMIYAASILDYAIFLHEYFPDLTFFEMLRYTPEIIMDPYYELRTDFLKNLGIGYALSLIVAVPTMIAQMRHKSGVYSAGRIDSTPV